MILKDNNNNDDVYMHDYSYHRRIYILSGCNNMSVFCKFCKFTEILI